VLSRIDTTNIYDNYDGFVIAESSETEARQLANSMAADEGSIWENVTDTDCKLVGITIDDSIKGVILTDFHAG
jgi:hypothetical protein